MKFKNWLNEMGYVVFDKDVKLSAALPAGNLFDLKYECMPPGPPAHWNKLNDRSKIFAKMPNSTNYLVHDESNDIKPLSEEEKQELITRGFVELPPNWYEYTDVYRGNDQLKKGIC